jgi:CheY-like chemotaxis protein
MQRKTESWSWTMKSILYIDDSEDDKVLVQFAARVSEVDPEFTCLEDFSKGIDYLTGRGRFMDRQQHPLPAFILLDYHVHGRTGPEFLAWLRAQPRLEFIPVCVYSDSDVPETIASSYLAGADCFLVKSTSFDRLRVVVRALASCAMAARPCLEPLSALPEHRCSSSSSHNMTSR